jgi:ATP-dependent DNA helicase RecG
MDSNILRLDERIKNAIQAGESNYREFKTAWQGTVDAKIPRPAHAIRKDIGETLVAFANDDGGMLLIGVEDGGTITGVPHTAEEIDTFLKAGTTNVHADTPLPVPQAVKLQLDGKTVLYFSVDKSTRFVHLTSDGRCLQRRDRESVPVPSEQIRFERQDQISREYDRVYVDGADLQALDLDLLKRAGNSIAPGMSVEKLLQLLDLADFDGISVRLRRAALLLFARDVIKWHPRCDVRVVRIAGHELKTGKAYNVKSDETVRGSVFLIMSRAWELLRPSLVQTVFGAEGLFEERIMYPEDACREALTNAIAHRDYSIDGRGIEVLVFDDRMEVRSPGGLLSNVRLDDLKTLKGVHQSRNVKLAGVLRELGYVQEMGEGIRRMYQLMKANDLVDPELSTNFESFVVTLKNRSVFSEEAQRWIDGFEKFNLSREEKKVVLLGHDGRVFSPQNVIDSLGIVDIDYYRQLLEGLQLKGILCSGSRGMPARAQRPGQPPRSTTRRGGKRNVARFFIRAPQECELHLSDLIRVLQALGPRTGLGPREHSEITARLSPSSPFKTRSFPLRRILAALNFADRTGSPSARLLSIWEGSGSPPQRKTPPIVGGRATEREVRRKDARTNRSLELAADSFPQQKTIFVGNLPIDLDRAEFEKLISEFGTVSSVKLPIDVFSGKLRGFAFVEYTSSAEAQRALGAIRGAVIGGRRLRTEAARPRE